MTIQSKVLDDTTGEPLQGANISAVYYEAPVDDPLVAVLGSTDGNGRFSFEDNAVTDWNGLLVEVSAIGHKPQWFWVDAMPDVIRLERNIKEIESVVIVSKKPKIIPPVRNKQNYVLPIALGTAAAISIAIYAFKA